MQRNRGNYLVVESGKSDAIPAPAESLPASGLPRYDLALGQRFFNKNGTLTREGGIEACKRIEIGVYAKYKLEADDYGLGAGQHDGEPATQEELEALVAFGNAAFETMVKANMGLVYSIARRNADHSQLGIADLTQEGVIGLIEAIKAYRYDLDKAFSTYAVSCIKHQIQRATMNTGDTIRIPEYIHGQYYRYREVAEEVGSGEKDPAGVIAEQLGTTREKVIGTLVAQRSRHVRSLDMPLGEGDAATLHDIIPDSLQQIAELPVFPHEIAEALTKGQLVIFRLYYGFDGGREYIKEEIADMLGITVDGVDRSLSRGRARLRERFTTNS